MHLTERGLAPHDAYAGFAAHYDAYTESPLFADWILGLERLARHHGLTGRRVLDAGCGTGNSFLPLLDLGYAVTGVDAVAAMLEQAQAKSGGRAALVEADLVDLPTLGAFDLVLCLNDVCNYLTDEDDLRSALGGLAANTRPGGVLVLDANTHAAFAGVFAATHRRERGERVFVWSSQVTTDAGEPLANAVLEVFTDRGDGAYARTLTHHRQRHHPRALLVAALDAAGFDVLAVHGQHDDGRRDPALDEHDHVKGIYVARRRPDHDGEGVRHQ